MTATYRGSGRRRGRITGRITGRRRAGEGQEKGQEKGQVKSPLKGAGRGAPRVLKNAAGPFQVPGCNQARFESGGTAALKLSVLVGRRFSLRGGSVGFALRA